jgi:hypothetical protein
MEIDTFRHWLSSAGAILTPRLITRGEEHGHLTIHREGRVAELPLTGLHHHLDAEMVRDSARSRG